MIASPRPLITTAFPNASSVVIPLGVGSNQMQLWSFQYSNASLDTFPLLFDSATIVPEGTAPVFVAPASGTLPQYQFPKVPGGGATFTQWGEERLLTTGICLVASTTQRFLTTATVLGSWTVIYWQV